MASEDYKKRKRKYIHDYNKGHYRSMTISFRMDKPEDVEVYEFLRSRYSTTQYIKDLARKDMENQK